VLEKDMLFATLDTQQRQVTLDSNHQFILVDTVGFVGKLPHGLVNAFKATLEEVTYADLLVHVVDGSYDNHDFHIDVTNRVLEEIGAGEKEKIMADNKIDLVDSTVVVPRPGEENLFISAKEDINIDRLLEMIGSKIFSSMVKTSLLIPYSRGDISSYLCEKATVLGMDYREDGTFFQVELKEADYRRLAEYEVI
jgi:GTP-binding protein HflX